MTRKATPDERRRHQEWCDRQRSATAELADTRRALLKTLSFDLLIQEVERRGHQVCLHQVCKFSLDRLPPGYPPRAEDDAPLPFDNDRDGR